jgi:hypothetical protein
LRKFRKLLPFRSFGMRSSMVPARVSQANRVKKYVTNR